MLRTIFEVVAITFVCFFFVFLASTLLSFLLFMIDQEATKMKSEPDRYAEQNQRKLQELRRL